MSETPQGQAVSSPDYPHQELSIRASELARITRERGMGILSGKFPPNMSSVTWLGLSISTQGFIQGEEVQVEGGDPPISHFAFRRLITAGAPGELRRTGLTYRQEWVASRYLPPVDVYTRRERSGLFGSKTIRTEAIRGYHGKHGETGWLEYEYFQYEDPLYDKGHRPGVILTLSVMVPPDIAAEIDSQVLADPYFPNAYQSALYPDLIGGDVKTHVRRLPARELLVVDCRDNPKNTQGQLRQYPQPLTVAKI